MQRKKANRIDQLEKMKGGVCNNKEDVLEEVSGLYEKLFR